MFPLGDAKYVIAVCMVGIVRTLMDVREDINRYKKKDDH